MPTRAPNGRRTLDLRADTNPTSRATLTRLLGVWACPTSRGGTQPSSRHHKFARQDPTAAGPRKRSPSTPLSATHPRQNSSNTWPAQPRPVQNSPSTQPRRPTRYKTLPTRHKTPILGHFAPAGRTLYRFRHQQPEQGEKSHAPTPHLSPANTQPHPITHPSPNFACNSIA